jgi:poly(A) polymerase
MNIIRKFLGFFSGEQSDSAGDGTCPEPVVVPREKHNVSRKNIDGDALKVLNRLNRFKHSAYLVGGGVRDLLLERKVKDFDIATSAHPNEIKGLFRNCRLIGRRFRLAHILFRGRKVIEVSTFRRHAGFSDNGELLIKSDNTFGTAEEDARRRDFTVNGLFYNIADFTVIDYVGGLKDIERKVIATIGDPEIRFREDPIRMLRAVRFAARLGFTFDGPTEKAIGRHRKEIWKGAVPRILDDTLRMLQQGSAAESFHFLHELGLLEVILPRLDRDFANEAVRTRIVKNLEALDKAPKPKEGLSGALLVSVLYSQSFSTLLQGKKAGADRTRLAAELLEADFSPLRFPKMQFERAKQMLAAQDRLENVGKKKIRPSQLVRKSYFSDALTLFELTQPSSKETRSIVRRWRALQKQIRSGDQGRRPPREATEEGADSAPKRRRRRRGGSRRGSAPRKDSAQRETPKESGVS